MGIKRSELTSYRQEVWREIKTRHPEFADQSMKGIEANRIYKVLLPPRAGKSYIAQAYLVAFLDDHTSTDQPINLWGNYSPIQISDHFLYVREYRPVETVKEKINKNLLDKPFKNFFALVIDDIKEYSMDEVKELFDTIKLKCEQTILIITTEKLTREFLLLR